MSWTSVPAAGSYLRGSVLSALMSELRPVTAAKASTSSKTSDASLADDADLVVPLVASATYDFELLALVSSAANAAGDIQISLSYPSGATVSAVVAGLVDTLASGASASLVATAFALDSSSPIGPWTVGCSTTVTGFRLRGRIAMGSTAGNLTVRWAQAVSNGNATNLLGGSTLTAIRVG